MQEDGFVCEPYGEEQNDALQLSSSCNECKHMIQGDKTRRSEDIDIGRGDPGDSDHSASNLVLSNQEFYRVCQDIVSILAWKKEI